MLVDQILEYYGRNPEAYPEVGDRWIVASVALLHSIYPFLSLIFAALPWVYFLWKKGTHKKDRTIFRKKIIIASIMGLVLGLIAPYLILAVAASLAASALYG